MKNPGRLIVVLIWMILACACTQRDKKGQVLDTPTSGSIKIAVDESLRPLIETEITVFEGIYKYAHVEAIYTTENEAVDALLKDSVRLAIITRKLTPEEEAILSSKQILPNQVKVAKDGIALILNPNNPDSLFNWNQLKDIVEGKLTTWKQFNPKSPLGDIEVILDNPGSGIIRYLQDSVSRVPKLPPNFFAVETNQAVLEEVSKKKDALGLIGVSWISDKDDSTANSFQKIIKVAGLSKDTSFYQPYQAYMALNQYPLVRDVVMISREHYTGLGSGFIAFVAGEKGQRIILKSGILPVTMPVRIVEVNRDPIFTNHEN